MTRYNKTITLFIFLLILIVNIPAGYQNSCMTNPTMVKRACCSAINSAIEKNKESISSQPCGCGMFSYQNSEIPFIKSFFDPAPNLKENNAKSESISHLNKFLFKPSLFESNFNIIFQPGSSSDKRIYILISAYLI